MVLYPHCSQTAASMVTMARLFPTRTTSSAGWIKNVPPGAMQSGRAISATLSLVRSRVCSSLDRHFLAPLRHTVPCTLYPDNTESASALRLRRSHPLAIPVRPQRSIRGLIWLVRCHQERWKHAIPLPDSVQRPLVRHVAQQEGARCGLMIWIVFDKFEAPHYARPHSIPPKAPQNATFVAVRNVSSSIACYLGAKGVQVHSPLPHYFPVRTPQASDPIVIVMSFDRYKR